MTVTGTVLRYSDFTSVFIKHPGLAWHQLDPVSHPAKSSVLFAAYSNPELCASDTQPLWFYPLVSA